MDTVFRAVVQLTITTKVMAINFEGLVKSLPMPADLRAMIIEIHEKQQDFSMPDVDDVTLMDFKTATTFIARKPNEIMKPTSTVLAKIVTKLNKPVTPRRRLLRTSVTLNPGPSCLDIASTTAKIPEKPLTLPPPFYQLPGMPMQMPMPMAIPIFARVPTMLPMRAYFETVKHDHPPLYKIKRMIEEDEKRWKEEKKRDDSEVSVEVAYSDESSDRSKDTDTDSDASEYNDVGSEDYDDSISVISDRGRRDRIDRLCVPSTEIGSEVVRPPASRTPDLSSPLAAFRCLTTAAEDYRSRPNSFFKWTDQGP